MDENEFIHLIRSLKTKRPLRVTYVSNKELGSLEWRPPNQAWEHLMSIPRHHIYKLRTPGYSHSRTGVAHQGLYGVYRKLLNMGLISPTEKSKFLS